MKKRGVASLPVVDQLPVPWVAQWTGEAAQPLRRPRIEHRPGPGGEPVATLVAENATLDRCGITWMTMTQRIGSGQPLFAQLHPDRQRESMDRGICQVCAAQIRPPVTFLIPNQWAYETIGVRRDRILTMHAPVCEGCAPIASRSCPHVRSNDFLFVSAGSVRPCAVVGDIYDIHTGQAARRGVICRHEDPASRLVIARQRLAELRDWEPVT